MRSCIVVKDLPLNHLCVCARASACLYTIRSLKLHDVLTADVLQHALYIMSVSAAATREKAAAIQLVSIMMDLSDVAIHFQDCAVRGCASVVGKAFYQGHPC